MVGSKSSKPETKETYPHGNPAAHAMYTDNWGSLTVLLKAILIPSPQFHIETVEQTGAKVNYASQALLDPTHVTPWTNECVSQPFRTNLCTSLPLVVKQKSAQVDSCRN